MQTLVITDGGVDDTLALFALGRLAAPSTIDVLATFGNVPADQALRNVLLLEQISNTHFHAICAGHDRPIAGVPRLATDVHGEDGLGGITARAPWHLAPDAALRIASADTLAQRYARLISIGPMTDVLHLARRGTKWSSVCVMGGAFETPGNISPYAEFNFFADPEAADEFFGSYERDIQIVPLDVCRRIVLTRQALDAWCASAPNATTEFLREIHQHYMDFYRRVEGIDGCYPHDFICVCAALHPELFSWSRGSVRVLTEGDRRGASMFEKRADGNCYIAERADTAKVLDMLRGLIVAA